MDTTDADVIGSLAGIAAGSPLDAIRNKRPAARDNAQESYRALFEPESPGDVSVQDRYAVAAFVTGLHGPSEIASFYAEKFAQSGASDEVIAAVGSETARGAAAGPYGHYPTGPLSREDAEGPVLTVADENRQVLGRRLAEGLEHAHLLVFRPRDSSSEAMRALLDAGWSETGIVTLSQLVAFLTFQIRVIAGLRVMARPTAATPGSPA